PCRPSASALLLAIRTLCLLPRSPPTSPLFPYTTLFRSHGDGVVEPHHLVHALDRLCLAVVHAREPAAEHGTGRHGGDLHPGDLQDRKSTRLNSSHGSISYAVFCLKKKN